MSQLTPLKQAFVLSCFPTGTRVLSAGYMQEMVPCPMRVQVLLPNGTDIELVLRVARNRGGVEREAVVFPILAECGLPVPTVLAGPVSDPDDPQSGAMTLNSLLPGRTLQDWSRDDEGGLELALTQLTEAVLRLHHLTPRLLDTRLASMVPQKTLASELQRLAQSDDPWVQTPIFAAAVSRLSPIVEAVDTPLVFSNGDYQPANFLFDGARLTGFLDFEKACFEDPLLTWSRFPVYNLAPLNRAGIVTRFLHASGFSQSDFDSRLAIFCLRTLITKVPVTGGTPAQQERRDHVLSVLTGALSRLR